MAYTVFVRDWYLADGSPGPGPKHTIHKNIATEEEARRLAKAYNATHDPGPRSRKAEFDGKPSPRKLSALDKERLKRRKKEAAQLEKKLSVLAKKADAIEKTYEKKRERLQAQIDNLDHEEAMAYRRAGADGQTRHDLEEELQSARDNVKHLLRVQSGAALYDEHGQPIDD